jgi:telomere length regulation protein
VLSPLALDKFLLTLALLSHAARHAPTFLAVLVPSVLELAATVGARHLAAPDSFGVGSDNPGERDASVTGSALELALAVLDAAGELDSGRTLARDSPQLVAGVAEWAGAVFEAENAGHKAGGGGGSREGRVRAAAAGVVVRVAEIGDKWGRTAF